MNLNYKWRRHYYERSLLNVWKGKSLRHIHLFILEAAALIPIYWTIGLYLIRLVNICPTVVQRFSSEQERMYFVLANMAHISKLHQQYEIIFAPQTIEYQLICEYISNVFTASFILIPHSQFSIFQ